MTVLSNIFIDTAVFIYYLEDHPEYAIPVEKFFVHCIENKVDMSTSVISIMEFSVKPIQAGRNEIIDSFKDFLIEFGIHAFPVNLLIAEEAARLRAKYQFLKSMDALQLAAAVTKQCTHFITNDKQLLQIREIEVITIDKLPAFLQYNKKQ